MLVQAGAFWMGRDDGPADEAPLHRVYVRDFWIERHKVSNAEFALFLNASGLRPPGSERRYDEDDADARIHRAQGQWLADPGFERHPVVEVSWFGARDYCAWKGRRLPNGAAPGKRLARARGDGRAQDQRGQVRQEGATRALQELGARCNMTCRTLSEQ